MSGDRNDERSIEGNAFQQRDLQEQRPWGRYELALGRSLQLECSEAPGGRCRKVLECSSNSLQ